MVKLTPYVQEGLGFCTLVGPMVAASPSRQKIFEPNQINPYFIQDLQMLKVAFK